MAAKTELLKAVVGFERLLTKSAKLASDNLDQHRREGVDLRRAISGQVSLIRTLGEQAFDQSGDREAFLRHFSKMRSAMALHQASWPLVVVALNDPAYQTSLKTTRAANSAFIEWVRDAAKT